jgi:hypothetical protein
MIHRQRLVPIVLLAIFVIAVCAVSLAHVQPGEPDTCSVATIAFEPAPAAPGDLAAPLIARAGLEPPRLAFAAATSPGSAAFSRQQVLAGPRVPRAPPRA